MGLARGPEVASRPPNTAVPAVPAVAWKESLLDEERVRAPRPRESPSGAPQDPLRAPHMASHLQVIPGILEMWSADELLVGRGPPGPDPLSRRPNRVPLPDSTLIKAISNGYLIADYTSPSDGPSGTGRV
jgi:hypothetical protein